MSLYKVKDKLYRAGVSLSDPPRNLPEEMEYSYFKGGKYNKFFLTGSYTLLPEACGRIFEIIHQDNIPTRDDFFIENYITDPSKTSEEENVTEILIPTT